MLHVKTILIALCALSMFAPSKTRADTNQSELYTDLTAQSAYLEARIREYFPEEGIAEVMIAIAGCESMGNRNGPIEHWLADGSLLPNDQGGSARGMFQVLMRLHRGDMTRRGLDPNNLDHYLTYVRYLYDRNNGFHDWYESRSCWRTTLLAQN